MQLTQEKARPAVGIAMAVFAAAYLLMVLYSYYDMQQATFLLRMVGYPVACAFAGITLSRRGMLRRPDIALLAAYVGWIALEALIVKRSSVYTYEQTVYFAIGFALCCYPAMQMLEPKGRGRAFRWTFHLLIAIITAVCVVTLVAVLMRTHLETSKGLLTGLLPQYEYRLRIFSTHANYLSPILGISLLMSLYMILFYRNRAVRVYYGLVAALMYVMLALTDSRAGMLATAVGIGLFAMVLVMNRVRLRSRPLVGVVAAGVAVCVAVGAFLGFSLALAGVQAVSIPTAQAQAVATLQGRDLLDDLPTLTQRTGIWREALDSIAAKPSILLWGTNNLHVHETIPNRPQFYGRLHNSFLQVLVALGLPGLLLLLAFLVVLALYSVRVFFQSRDTLPEAEQFLPALLAVCMLIAFVESYFFLESYGIVGPLFFYIAGYVAALAGGRAARGVWRGQWKSLDTGVWTPHGKPARRQSHAG